MVRASPKKNPIKDFRVTITRDVPMAFLISIFANSTNAGMIKKPPPAPSFAKGGSGRGAQVSTGGTTAPTPPVLPDVNTVGASGINQLADALGTQTQQPVQAYVVSNDVTTAQGLERNIVDGASIG